MLSCLKLRHQLQLLVFLALVMCCVYSFMYYFSFSSITNKRTTETAEQMMEQVAQNVVIMMDSVRNSAKGLSYDRYVQQLLTSENPVERIQLHLYVTELTDSIKSSNNNIFSIGWSDDELVIISDAAVDDNLIIRELHNTYHFTDQEFRKPIFTSLIKDSGKPIYYFGYIFPIYNLETVSYPKVGCGIILLDLNELEKLVKLNNITENSLFAILDQNNNVVVSNSELQAGDVYQDIFWDDNDIWPIRSVIDYKGWSSLAQCMEIEDSGWKVVSIIPKQELNSELDGVLKLGIISSLISVVVLLFFGHLIIRNIAHSTNTIVEFLLNEETSGLKKRLPLPKQDELAVIAKGINRLLDDVECMAKKIVDNQTLLYESKLAEQDAELAALQSQINPHFLYNTLNCISNMGIVYDIPEIEEIAVAMSNIYRYSIKGDNVVCLKDELQCISWYIRIMNIRFDDKFEMVYRIDESTLDLCVLRMILQPIVENAVYHGMELRSRKGKLIIESSISEENQLVLSVHNDGRGMPPAKLEALKDSIKKYENVGLYMNQKSGIGLGNINKRIKLQFGNQYGLYLESEEEEGTTVTLILPVRQG